MTTHIGTNIIDLEQNLIDISMQNAATSALTIWIEATLLFFRGIAPPAFVLGTTIVFHEFGHYLAAKLCGIAVESFSVGLGPVLIAKKDSSNTEWRLSAIPIGGYIKLAGDEESIYGYSLWKRIFVVCAGPTASFLLAIILYFSILVTSGAERESSQISSIATNSRASYVGINSNDVVVAVSREDFSKNDNAKLIVSKIKLQDYEIIEIIKSQDLNDPSVRIIHPHNFLKILDESKKNQSGVFIMINRDNKLLSFFLPQSQNVNEPFGIALLSKIDNINPFRAFKIATIMAAKTGKLVINSLINIGKSENRKDLGGIIRIAQTSREASLHGMKMLTFYTAGLSANLAVVNMLPIPLLDGGRAIMYALGGAISITKRRKITKVANFVGGFALLLIFALSTYNDIFYSVSNHGKK